MHEGLIAAGVVFSVMCGICLVISIVMFFKFNIPVLRRDISGKLEQKQIAEIRKNNSSVAGQKRKINVFEEMEKRAKEQRLENGDSTPIPSGLFKTRTTVKTDTTVLKQNTQNINPNFIIEKNIVFVSTSEVI